MRLARSAVCALLLAGLWSHGPYFDTPLALAAANEDASDVELAAQASLPSQEPAIDSAGPSVDDAVSAVKSRILPPAPQVQSVLGPRHGCGKCPPMRDCECEFWDFRLDMGFSTGTATFGDNEGVRYRLEEKLHTRRGNEYSFWQSWRSEHSYLNTSEWGLGAEQRIPDFWNDAELRMKQEYSDYKDHDFNDFRRKQFDFRLQLDPSWEDVRLRSWLDYRFRNVEYPNFPGEGYVLHDLRLDGMHQVNEKLTASGGLRFADYNYDVGSTRSNNTLQRNARLDYRPDETLSVYVQGMHEDKNYNSRKDRNFDETSLGAGFRYDPDERSSLSTDLSRSAYDRPFNPDLSYDQWQVQSRYWRQLSCVLDVELRHNWRDKRHDIDPSNDLLLNGYAANFNYAPNCEWTLFGGWSHDDYDYGNPARSNAVTQLNLGAGYRLDDVNAGLYWRRNSTRFTNSAVLDYDKDDYDFELSQRGCDWRWRSYVGFGRLRQAFVGNLNDFNERRLGFEWGYEFDCNTELSLRFDHFQRDYQLQTAIEDNRLEAGLSYRW